MSRGLLVLLCGLFTAVARPATYTVDAGSPGREVSPLNGVNAGPGHMKHLPGANFADQYRQMGIPLVRTHDYYGPCDLSQIFPWLYGSPAVRRFPRFSETDATIAEIEAAGCQVLFRLGESWYNDNPHNQIPSDFSAVADACVAVVSHYGGHQCTPYNARIRLWEIWNEPDHGMFWDLDTDPDSEQFLQLYVQVAKRLRDEFPWIKIGGPGAAGGPEDGQVDFARRLAEACRDADAPLDFYSWHSYNPDHEGPYHFAGRAQAIRQALNAAGSAKTYNILDEWNSAHYKPLGEEPSPTDTAWNESLGNAEGAAFSASALIYLHLHSDLRHACRYRGDYWKPEDGYGLIEADGSLKKPGYAFEAYAGLFPQQGARTMHLLPSDGGDLEHHAIMATTDEPRSVVNVLISQYKDTGSDLALTIAALPDAWSRPTLEHYVVSAVRDCSRVAARELAAHELPDVHYTFRLGRREVARSSVHLVRVYDAAKFPVYAPTQMAPAHLPGQRPRPERGPRPGGPRRPFRSFPQRGR